MTIESLSVEMLRSGKFSVDEIVEKVRKIFPGSKTTKKCVYYYSSKYKIGLSRKVEVNQEELDRLRKELVA